MTVKERLRDPESYVFILYLFFFFLLSFCYSEGKGEGSFVPRVKLSENRDTRQHFFFFCFTEAWKDKRPRMDSSALQPHC